MKIIWRRALAFVLTIAINVSAFNVPVYAQESVTKVNRQVEKYTEPIETDVLTKVNAAQDEMVSGDGVDTPITENTGWDGVTSGNVYEAEDFRVSFTLTSYWDAGYNAVIKLENTGDSTIQNWYLGFDYNNSITDIWNAEVSEKKETAYVVKNVGWNQDIEANGTIEFGISGDHAFRGFPEKYELISASTEVAENDYTIEYQVDSDWGTGFYGSISVTNNTDTALEDWVLEFDFDREITEIWDGVIENHEGNHYVVRNSEYNSTIASGKAVSIGIKGCEGNADDKPYNYKLISYSDYVEKIKTETDLNLDSDNDGAQDYIEEAFGTDKNKADTDGDGLSDFAELYTFVLDPLNTDTDGNGVADGEEDLDGDGLSNLTEVQIGTSIVKQDTDADGLNDEAEYNEYGTNPLSKDTDEDGASDSKEIEYGTNPLVFEDEFEISFYADTEDTVEASVDIILDGSQVDSLAVEKYENDFLFPTDMPGYIGGAYDFSVEGTFDKATIRFEFSEDLLEETDFEPVIYYFNEEKQLLEELDTTVAGNVASAEVTHFSKYILLNRKVYQDSFEWQDVWSSTGYTGVEIVLVIDNSLSMETNDPDNKRLDVARDLIDRLPENSKIGIVKFAGTSYKLTSAVTDDKEIAKSYLTTEHFTLTLGTYMYEAIGKAFSLFESKDDNIMKMMVVLSDGETADAYRHSSTVTTANSRGVKIYTVGLGSSTKYFMDYLKPLANNTAGAFYLASDASELENIYTDINKKIDIETDSDEDGIADYYEENMVMFNGVTIKLEKDDPDSDGDGLLDGEEVVELNYQYNADKTQVIVTGRLLSNPLLEDTDGDGLTDNVEINFYGTSPVLRDTDEDKLNDKFEIDEWYDPLLADGDGDGRLDYQEYIEGTSPYSFDKIWQDYVWEFVQGFFAGDIIHETDSVAILMGQIVGSFVPYIDIRDVAANLVYGDYGFAFLSFIGLATGGGDAAKAGGAVIKFVIKNADNLPMMMNLFEGLLKNFPDLVADLSKNDMFTEMVEKLAKADTSKLTRSEAEAYEQFLRNAGVSADVIKGGSKVVPNIGFDDFTSLKKIYGRSRKWECMAPYRGTVTDWKES